MDRLEIAQKYALEFSKINPYRCFKSINPNNEGLGFVLAYLYKNRDKTICAGDLAKALNVSTARVAAALKKLEEQQLITREDSKTDSRKTIVNLTDAGVKQTEETGRRLLGFIADVIDYVGTDDLDEYIRISSKINDAIKSMKCKGEGDV